jgi:predicted signal transduction protein with EAL and GGDEF domain
LESALTFTQSATEEQLTAADVTIHLDGSRLMSAFALQAPPEHESMLHTCTRIQHALSNAPTLTDLLVQLTASIGFAASNKLERPTAEGLMQASFSALSEARRKAPSAARAFSETMLSRQAERKKITRDAKRAFEQSEIFAYFQPQLHLHDGTLSEFEALAPSRTGDYFACGIPAQTGTGGFTAKTWRIDDQTGSSGVYILG